MIGVTAIASVSVYFSQGYINPYLTAPIALGVLLGSFVGSKLLIHLRGQLIRGLFIGILAVLAGQMLLKAVGIGF